MNANNDEGKLISGKEALIALANGEDVQLKVNGDQDWKTAENCVVGHFLQDSFEFRLAPRTITINGIEVPAPFEPKQSDWDELAIYFLQPQATQGWECELWCEYFDTDLIQFGAWRTEEEIKQVVAALRTVFGGAV